MITSLVKRVGLQPPARHPISTTHDRSGLGVGSDRSEFLCLSDNKLGAIPEDISRLSLPASLGELARLRELHVSNNALRALPDSIGRLGELRILDLRNNHIEALPASVGDLRTLLYLDLRANALTTLPDTIGDLPRLQKLDLRWTHVDGTPSCVTRLEQRGCVVLR